MTTTTESKTINLNNGNGWSYDASDIETASPELEEEINRLWDVIAEFMDDDTREDVHADMAPCSNKEFLTEYLRRAPYDIVIG